MTQAERIAEELMNFAAWYSTQSPFGWAAPICGTIQDAARILRGGNNCHIVTAPDDCGDPVSLP